MKNTLMTLLFLATAPAVFANSIVDCKWGTDAECRLEWNMAASPRAQYVLERYDTETHAWQPFETLRNRPAGVTRQPVPVDNLYRVSACSDYLQRKECVASTVRWVPFVAEDVDELPDRVSLSTNKTQFGGVQKDQGTDLANFDYNVGRVVYILNTINPDDVTPMTPPQVRHFDYEVRNGRLHRDVGRSYEVDRSKITTEIFLHNEIYIVWKSRSQLLRDE